MASEMRSDQDESLIDTSHTQPHPKIILSDLCEDVLLLIRDFLEAPGATTPMKSLALTNHRLKALVTPVLFKNIHLNTPIKAASTIFPAHLCTYVHRLRLNLFGSLWWWASGNDVTDLMHFIRRFDNLQELNVKMLRRTRNTFHSVYEQEQQEQEQGTNSSPSVLTIPQVKSLTTNRNAAFLARHCPSLTNLKILRHPDDSEEDDEETSEHIFIEFQYLFTPENLYPTALNPALTTFQRPSLKKLHMSATCTKNEINSLAQMFPALTHLTLRTMTEFYTTYWIDIGTLTEILGRTLPNLRSLNLLSLDRLGVGYLNPALMRCLDRCTDAEARLQVWKAFDRNRVDQENKVAGIAFGNMKGLEELWIGETRVAKRCVEKKDEGSSDAEAATVEHWMWERQIKGAWAELFTEPELAEEGEAVVVAREIGCCPPV